MDDFEQDWQAATSGDYTFDDIASGLDTQDIGNLFSGTQLPELEGPGFFTDAWGTQRELTPNELEYLQTGGTSFDFGDLGSVNYDPSGVIQSILGDTNTFYTPDRADMPGGGFVQYQDITDPKALVESYDPSGRYGAWHDGVYVDYANRNDPLAAVNTYGPTGSGAKQTTYEGGKVTQIGADGSRFVTSPGGSTVVTRPDGTSKTYKDETTARAGTGATGPSGTGMKPAAQQQPNNMMQALLMMLLMSQLGKSGGSSGGSNAVIPQLTAKREQTPYMQQRPAGYRPGQGGVTYFNPTQYAAAGGVMGESAGGIASLGKYAAGGKGRLVAGNGDGVSDDVPATIDDQQPARIARGEYVIPARVVAELGNGSTDAGAERLDEMVTKIENSGRKAARGADSKAYKHLKV